MQLRIVFRLVLFSSIMAISGGACSQPMKESANDLTGLLNSAVSQNIAGARSDQINECKDLFYKEIENPSGVARGLKDQWFSQEFVLYFVVARSWHAPAFYYVGISPKINQILVFRDNELDFRKRLSQAQKNEFIDLIKTQDDWRYRISKGVQDGSCSFIVIKRFGKTTSVILPPGGSIDSGVGRPLQKLQEWADKILPPD